MLEQYYGSAVEAGGSEYKRKDSLAVVLDGTRIRLVGPTEIPVAQDIDANGHSRLGYEFTICEWDEVHVLFNNYACNRSKYAYSGFTEYSGEFNKVTGRLQLSLQDTNPSRELVSVWNADYACKAVK